MTAIDDIEFKIARLDLRSGDILVMRFKERLSRQQVDHMRATIDPIIKGHKVLVLESGADLAILTAAEIEARSTAPTSDEAA
jgi:hypothetical protein